VAGCGGYVLSRAALRIPGSWLVAAQQQLSKQSALDPPNRLNRLSIHQPTRRYANAKIYKCPTCERPSCYRAYSSSKEDSPPCEQ